MARKLVVEIVGDTRSLERSLKQAERQTRTFSSRMSSLGGSLLRGGVFAAATAGAVGFTAALKAGFDELNESQKVAAQTTAALKSTGQVAGVTAGEIEKLAGTIRDYSGIDDEAVQSAENLLLTFTNIRNVVGRNNDIFNQATKAAADLSVRFGTDLNTAAVQVGKALNDPIRGLTALRRIGISFTAEQASQIKTLVASGHVLEAQKIIMRELTRETGGAARAAGQTLGGQINILKGHLQDLAGEIVQNLSPEIVKLVKRFDAWVTDADNQKKILEDSQTVLHDTATALEAIGNAALFVADAYGKMRDKIGDVNSFFEKHGLGFLNKGLLQDIKDEKLWERRVVDRIRGGAGILDGGGGGGGDFTGTEAQPARRRRGGAAAPGADAAREAATKKARDAAKRARDAAVKLAELRKQWFDAMIGRRLDRLQDEPLRQQIADLDQIAALIQQRINATNDVTRRLNLEDQLLGVRRQRKDVVQQLADQAEERRQAVAEVARKQREETMGWLDIKLRHAETTKSIKDDLAVLNEQEQAIRQQIRVEGRTLENVNALMDIQDRRREKVAEARQKAAEDRKAAAEAARARLTASQFRQLGLGPTGAALIPLGATLLKRVGRIQDAIRGTALDTAEHRKMLANIRETLVGGLGRLAPEVRQKIAELLDALTPSDEQKKKTIFNPSAGFLEMGGRRFRIDWFNDPAAVRMFQRMGGQTAPLPLPVRPDDRAIGRGMNVQTMNLNLYGVQNVPQFETELEKRAMQRPKPRRGA